MAAQGDDNGDSYDYGLDDMMQEPQDFYPPSPPPTQQSHTMRTGPPVTLHVVGHSATEAHHVWNGSCFVADFFEADPRRVRGKAVLELGAAAGLPSLVAARLGARCVVVTDFPDPELVSNMQRNIEECDIAVGGTVAGRVEAVGFVWGADPAPLLARLRVRGDEEFEGEEEGNEDENDDEVDQDRDEAAKEELEMENHDDDDDDDCESDNGDSSSDAPKFDVLILADLLFRHSEHGALVKTIKETMRRRPTSVAYVFFTSYRPWKQDRDLAFFDVARAAGLEVAQVAERKLDRPLFEGDPGDLEVQKTVRGFEVRWPKRRPRRAEGARLASG